MQTAPRRIICIREQERSVFVAIKSSPKCFKLVNVTIAVSSAPIFISSGVRSSVLLSGLIQNQDVEMKV